MNDYSRNWFNKLFNSRAQKNPENPGKYTSVAGPSIESPHKKGDLIGQKYMVHQIIGKGGFGIVYLVSYQNRGFALKTFQAQYLADQEIRARFHKEASVWIELGSHPNLVTAYLVDEISGMLCIVMEYIVPNEEGLNSLEGYMHRRPPDLAQSLYWALQICSGMEYAFSRGVRAHRDLKPANIMISQDKTARITDFGLAGVLTESPGRQESSQTVLSGQTMRGIGFGTPTYMPPEQFENAAGCDQRSDIYSLGIILYQLASGGRVPFTAPVQNDYWQAMQRLHGSSPVPGLNSPLFPIIQHCLEKSPGKRYQTFGELRKDLEILLQTQTGEKFTAPQAEELKARDWTNKSYSLHKLGRFQEAVDCLDKALELDPRDVAAWTNRGNSLNSLGRYDEAVLSLNQALELDPNDSAAWQNKGMSLSRLGRYAEALDCFDKAIAIDPFHADAWIWMNKANCLNCLGRSQEAIRCCDKALEIDPRDPDIWFNKGFTLKQMSKLEDIIPLPGVVSHSLNSKRDYEDGISCFDQALALDPRYANAWYQKALLHHAFGFFHEEADAFRHFLKLTPPQNREQIEYARKRLSESGDL